MKQPVKQSVFFLLFILLTVTVSGQEVSGGRPPLSQRMFFGGSFGLQFGTVTNIDLAPAVGVWVLPRVAVAAGPTYQYYKDPYGRTSVYGGKAFTILTLIKSFNNIVPIGLDMGVFLQGEYQGLSLEKSYFTGTEATGRIYSGAFLAGAGISQPMGRKSFMNITFLWALSDPEYYYYGSPELSISFYF